MKEDFDKLIQIRTTDRSLEGTGEEMQAIADKYNVSVKTAYNRFKSTYRRSPRDAILDSILPEYNALCSTLLNAEDSKEFFKLVDLPQTLRKGIFDKTWGVSTFQKAKVKLLKERMYVDYNPVREDNRSLWYSQLLGDGSYNSVRHAFIISHGEKQIEYLKWKVSLINKAFPKTPTNVSVLTHSQGHKYGSYYSGNIGNIDIPTHNREEVIPLLTPLGWLLWWLDDGGHYQNIAIFSISSKIVDSAIKELSTYGIKARKGQNGVIMCGEAEDVKFYKNFIEPFIDVIPKCMQYKVKI